MIDNSKKKISALYKVSYFVGSEDSHKLNLSSVSIALLFVIARYASMTSDGICKAHHEKIMRDARIKNSTSYGKHLRKLQELNLITSTKNWKLARHQLGTYFDEKIFEKENNLSQEESVLAISDSGEKISAESSTTLNVSDQQRLTLSTIEKKKKESIKKNNINLIDLREKKQKILYEKKEINMAKENYMYEHEQYVKFFYGQQHGIGIFKNESRKKLSATQQEYINRERIAYHEACRREALEREYGAAHLAKCGIPVLDWKTFSIFAT